MNYLLKEYENRTLNEAEILAAIDFECFDDDAMTASDWFDAFSNHKNMYIIGHVDGRNKYISAGVTTWSRAGIGYLYSNAVIPEYQHKGLGSEIIKVRIEKLHEEGIFKIQANTRIDNAASIASLRKFGFKPISYVTDFYADYVDAILWEMM